MEKSRTDNADGGMVYLQLSVIMPVYKTPEVFLEPALRSVLAETELPLEVILIDDSPGEESSAILDKAVVSDSRVRLIKNARNWGVSYSRNKGLEVARGEYVAFHDSDDLVVAGAYKKLVECARKHKLDALRGRLVRGPFTTDMQGDGSLCVAALGDAAWGRNIAMVAYGMDWSPVGRVIKREFAKAIRFDMCTQHAEDLLYNIHVIGSGKRLGLMDWVVYLPQACPGSLSRRVPDVWCYIDFAHAGYEVAKLLKLYSSLPHTVRLFYINAAFQIMFADRRVRQVVAQDFRGLYLERIKIALELSLCLRPSLFRLWTRLLLRYLEWRPKAIFASCPVAYYALKGLMKYHWL